MRVSERERGVGRDVLTHSNTARAAVTASQQQQLLSRFCSCIYTALELELVVELELELDDNESSHGVR